MSHDNRGGDRKKDRQTYEGDREKTRVGVRRSQNIHDLIAPPKTIITEMWWHFLSLCLPVPLEMLDFKKERENVRKKKKNREADDESPFLPDLLLLILQ